MNKRINFIAIVFMLSVMSIFTGCVDSKAVQIAKKTEFSHVGVDVNLETLVKGYFSGAKWSSSTTEDGKTYVDIKGKCHKKDETVDVLLKYEVDMEKEKISFSRLEYNEKRKTVFDYLQLFIEMCKASGKEVEPSAELAKGIEDLGAGLDNLGDGLNDFGATMSDFGKTLSESVGNSMKELDSKMEDLGSKVEGLGSDIGSSLENTLDSLGSSLNGLFGN